jgi:bacteriorhodopsin
MFKKYALYLLRWQLSTPILAVVLILLANMPTLLATIIANLISGLFSSG